MIRVPRSFRVVALRGGFGNQLFGWAYGQALIDKGHLVAYDPGNRLGRGYALRGLIPSGRLLPLPALVWRKLFSAETGRPRTGGRSSLVSEDQFSAPVIKDVESSISFHWGYWQSLDYFVESKLRVQEQLVAWLDLPSSPRDECAVHVRRGDYVSDAGAAAVMGVLPLGYYRGAIQQMKLKGYKQFVVYSDDRPWALENLQGLDGSVRVADSSESDDFWHMASSRALITANSSFSWWAGFIVDSRGGDVLAPKDWFADRRMDSSRLIPDSWMSL